MGMALLKIGKRNFDGKEASSFTCRRQTFSCFRKTQMDQYFSNK